MSTKKIILVFLFLAVGLNSLSLYADEFNPLDVEFGTDLEQLILENADFFLRKADSTSYFSTFGLSASGEGPYAMIFVRYEVDTENKIKGIGIQMDYDLEYDPDFPQRVFNRINEMDNNILIRPEINVYPSWKEEIEWRYKDYSYMMVIYTRTMYSGSSMFGIELFKRSK